MQKAYFFPQIERKIYFSREYSFHVHLLVYELPANTCLHIKQAPVISELYLK